MRRLIATFPMLLFVMLAACQPHPPVAATEGYAVMFEGKPSLTTAAVYYRGVQIGEIVAARAGAGNVRELTVTVGGEFRDLMTEDAVFYPLAGHLEYNRLSPSGDPLPDGSAVLGFPSAAAYAWYRVSTALSRRRAAEKARTLQDRIEWGDPVAIPVQG